MNKVQRTQADNSEHNWWRGGVIYQIYPRSFYDANGDGVGDLAGITEKLDYVASLNVDAIWLSPFFKSPMKDFGYDVSDYRDVDPLFGSLDDFKTLIHKAHELGIKIIIDQVLSHSSDQHDWFHESRQSRDNSKSDWYVWADAKPDGTVPNNWLSVFGGSAWTWDSRRNQYYLHNFLSSQPDLNFHNPKVQQQCLDDVEFWLKLGVDGIRLDACNFYFHDQQLRNNPPVPPEKEKTRGVSGGNPYGFQQHIYDICQSECVDYHQRLRDLFNRYPGTASVGEIGADDALAVMAEYMSGGDKLFMAYTFDLLTTKFKAPEIVKVVDRVETELTDGWPCWAFSNHDVVRAVSRLPKAESYQQLADQVRLLVALLTSLRGSVCVYQGEELGLPEADIPFEKIQDPYGIPFWPEFKGRDGCRTPMPWQQDAPFAGFIKNSSESSDVEPWLPVSKAHQVLSADAQLNESASPVLAYQQWLAWRKDFPALIEGDFSWCGIGSEWCEAIADKDFSLDDELTLANGLMFKRSLKGESILVAFNLSNKPLSLPLDDTIQIEHVLDGHGFNSSASQNTIELEAYQAFYARIACSD